MPISIVEAVVAVGGASLVSLLIFHFVKAWWTPLLVLAVFWATGVVVGPLTKWDIYPARRSLRYERAPSRSDRGPLGNPWNRWRGVGGAPRAPRDSFEDDHCSRVTRRGPCGRRRPTAVRITLS